MNTVTETQALPITITPIVMVQTTTTTLTLVVTIAIHKVILPITITLIVMVQTTTTGVVTQAHTELVETTTILMTDRPTITPMMDMITFSMVVVILHTLMATVVPVVELVVELVEDLVGLVMRDAKTTTQSATLMKIPVLITMMPIHQNAEITIPILSLPLTFAVLAMEVAPEAILEATAMEMARVTELAMGQELDTDMVQEVVQEVVQDLKQSYMMVASMTIH
jgi:hypothetical protein